MPQNYRIEQENDVLEIRDHESPGFKPKQILVPVTKTYVKVILVEGKKDANEVMVEMCRRASYPHIVYPGPGFLNYYPYEKIFITLDNTLDVIKGQNILGEFYILPDQLEPRDGYSCYRVKSFTIGDVVDPAEKDRIKSLYLEKGLI